MTDTPTVRLAPIPDSSAPADPVEVLRDHPAAGRAASLATVVGPLLLSANEAADLCRVSPATWYRMVSAGRTPAPLRLSPGCVRYSREQLVEWIRLGCISRKEFEARLAAKNAGGRK